MSSTLLLLALTTANAQLVDAECGTWPPGMPFPDALYLERAKTFGYDIAWREYAVSDAIRAGKPPAPSPAGSTPLWISQADHVAVARTSDLGVLVSRLYNRPQSQERGVSDGYIISAWAFVSTGTPMLIASTWLAEKNDKPSPQCANQFIIKRGNIWSATPHGPNVSKIAAAVPPSASLREADNELIAAATCRERWPPIIAAAGENRGTFLLPRVGEVLGGKNLRSILNLLPDEPVRWRRMKFLSSRDGTLGLSIGRLVNCDDPKAIQTYISAWVLHGEYWRLELFAIVP